MKQNFDIYLIRDIEDINKLINDPTYECEYTNDVLILYKDGIEILLHQVANIDTIYISNINTDNKFLKLIHIMNKIKLQQILLTKMQLISW